MAWSLKNFEELCVRKQEEILWSWGVLPSRYANILQANVCSAQWTLVGSEYIFDYKCILDSTPPQTVAQISHRVSIGFNFGLFDIQIPTSFAATINWCLQHYYNYSIKSVLVRLRIFIVTAIEVSIRVLTYLLSPSSALLHIGRHNPSIHLCHPQDRLPHSTSYPCIECLRV